MALPVLAATAARLGVALPEGALEYFERYRELLLAENARAGLTAITQPAAIEARHFGESLALFAVLRGLGALSPREPGGVVRLADLGPGGGFPGVPMAIVDPSIAFTLIEAHGRRAAFLARVIDELAVARATVHHARAEDVGRAPGLRGAFDVVVARALAPLAVLVEYALPLLREGGLLATPKGSRAREELEAAAGAIAALGGTAEEPHPLPLPPDAAPQDVLLVRRTGPVDERYPRRAGVPARRPLG